MAVSNADDSRAISRRAFVVVGSGAVVAGLGCTSSLRAESKDRGPRIRIAQIGLEGHWGEIRSGLPMIEDCELAAVTLISPYDDDKELDEAYRKQCPAFNSQTRVYRDDYRKMLDEVKPDVVATFVPFGRMGEVNIEAARRGCHIITEKPIALSMDELNTLRTELKKNRGRLTVLLPFRQMGPFVAAHQAVKKGMIGEPLLISAQKSYRWGGSRPAYFKTRREYGGSIPWVAIHAIDFIRFVTGLDYVEVTARAATKTLKEYSECEDCGALLFVMNNGGQATITFDFLRPAKALSHADDRIRVAGSEGVVEVRSGNPPLFCEVMTRSAEPRQLVIPETKANLLVDFVAELRGGPPAGVSQEDAFRATEVALKARDAADARTTVAL